MTWWMLRHGVDVDDAAAVAAHAEDPVLVSGTDPRHHHHTWTAPTWRPDPSTGVTSAVQRSSTVPVRDGCCASSAPSSATADRRRGR
jgi:cytidylate kinase